MRPRLRIISISFAYFICGGALLSLFIGGGSAAAMLVIAVAWFLVCAINPLFARPGRHLYFLTSLAALLVFGCILWPSVRGWYARWVVVSALRDASSVRLEEYNFGQELTASDLPRAEWSKVADAMPIRPDIGIPGSVTFCFIPHHRVVVSDPRGERFRLTLCFECDQATTESSGIVSIPYAWRGSLRRLFTEHQIPIRDSREYSSLRQR